MKLANNTVAVLQNFASISPYLWVDPGNELVTLSKVGKAVFAKAEVEDTFPQEFGIYDLNKFLSVLSLHEAPELEFDDKCVYIKGCGGRSKITYRMAAKDLLEGSLPKSKTITLPSVDVTFMLQEDDLNVIMKTVKVLSSRNVAITSDGKTNISLVAFDSKNDSDHTEQLEICGASGCNGSSFNHWFASENWQKMVPGTYEVKVCSKGIAEFTSQDTKLQYVIKMEVKS